MRLCPKCLKSYKRSPEGKAARKTGTQWGKGKWPSFIYHNAPTRLCPMHARYAQADSAQRRSKKLNTIPRWADSKAISKKYLESINATQRTGIKHHVDHIIPLRGKYVSGLHIAENLQVI